MSRRFTDPEFEEVCVNFWRYVRAHRFFAPRMPPAFSFVVQEGGSNPDVDYPLNPFFPALVVALDELPADEQIAFYAVYICSAYRKGKKVPIKVIAYEMGINKANFYKKANNTARKVWNKAKNLKELHAKFNKVEDEDVIID